MNQAKSIRTLEIATPRLAFACRVAGDAEQMPVLMVHGSFATSRWWEPLMSLLAEGFFLLAPDLRGTGGTWMVEQRPPMSEVGSRAALYDIRAQAEDLAALVDEMGWQEFDLVGHSSGGAIALDYTLDNPERVRTLTLIDTAPAEGVYTPIDMMMLLEQMQEDRTLLRNALAALMPGWAGSVATEFFEQLVEDAAQMDPVAFTAHAEALNAWNRFGDVGRLTMPTLLIWGELDSVVDRDTMTRTLIAIPGANNLEVIRNAGHCPMLEAPAAVAERFIEFVTDDLEDYAAVRRDAL